MLGKCLLVLLAFACLAQARFWVFSSSSGNLIVDDVTLNLTFSFPTSSPYYSFVPVSLNCPITLATGSPIYYSPGVDPLANVPTVFTFSGTSGSTTITAQTLDYLLKGMCAVKTLYSYSGGTPYIQSLPVAVQTPRIFTSTLGGTGSAIVELFDSYSYSYTSTTNAPLLITGEVTHAVASPTSIVLNLPNRVLPTAVTYPPIVLTTSATSVAQFAYSGPYLADIKAALNEGIATITVNGATTASGPLTYACSGPSAPVYVSASSNSAGYLYGTFYPMDDTFYFQFYASYGAKTAKIQDATGAVLLDLLPYGALQSTAVGSVNGALVVSPTVFTELQIPGKYFLVVTAGLNTYSTPIMIATGSKVSTPFLASNVPSSSTAGGTASYTLLSGQSTSVCFDLAYNATGVTSIQFVPQNNVPYYANQPLPYICGDFAVDCSVSPRTFLVNSYDSYLASLLFSPYSAPSILIKSSGFPSGDIEATFALSNPYTLPSLTPTFGGSVPASVAATIPKRFKRKN